MKKKDFLSFMQSVIDSLRANNSHGTAHIYQNSLRTLIEFSRQESLPFRKITPQFLKRLEEHLYQKQKSWNTISTYLRALRATYNRAVDLRLAPYVPHLFKHVYTGTRADKKRALDSQDMALIFQSWNNRNIPSMLHRTQGLFILMFLLRGLPFVDLAYLHKKDLKDNILTYRRHKTGRQLTVSIPPEAMKLLAEYLNVDPRSPYLFSILRSTSSREAYQEYQRALRSFNYELRLLSKVLQLQSGLSSYTARHTWATLAYYCEIHPGIISEAMGHSSIKVTETYLKPFNTNKINEANNKIISLISGGRHKGKNIMNQRVTL